MFLLTVLAVGKPPLPTAMVVPCDANDPAQHWELRPNATWGDQNTRACRFHSTLDITTNSQPLPWVLRWQKDARVACLMAAGQSVSARMCVALFLCRYNAMLCVTLS